jgi:phosphopantothenoylcysteine synthetase/decarboxylase
MVEKDYGEQFINPAKSFIEQVSAKFEEWQMRDQPQQMETDDEDDEDEDDDLFKDDEFTAMDQEDDDEVNKHFDRVRQLAGLR